MNEECSHIKWAVCQTQNCHCSEGHVSSSNRSQCLPVAVEKNSPCREDSQCEAMFKEGAVCLGEGVCSCGDMYTLLNDTCQKNSRKYFYFISGKNIRR